MDDEADNQPCKPSKDAQHDGTCSRPTWRTGHRSPLTEGRAHSQRLARLAAFGVPPNDARCRYWDAPRRPSLDTTHTPTTPLPTPPSTRHLRCALLSPRRGSVLLAPLWMVGREGPKPQGGPNPDTRGRKARRERGRRRRAATGTGRGKGAGALAREGV